ncbi:hypothetical protein [Actinoplanes sp. TFC3]|uniref:hypothetical protein n=1 Tax=Actinoplanes sp. TFC3 TaxID=1710355 RepID=UPI0008319D89|nr:hypothetical protein [Actinoplanes sp. TFC3]
MPGVTLLHLDEANAPLVGTFAAQGDGSIPRAHAVWAARQHTAYYLTTEPEEVVDLLVPEKIHPIPTKDA